MDDKINRCKDCGMHHHGDICPDVKQIEYFPGGNIKRVEFYSTYEKRLEGAVNVRVQMELRKE